MAVNAILRGDALADIPPESAAKIIAGATGQSAALQLFTQLPMNRKQTRIRIEDALPMAYWVSGDTGLKATTKGTWTDKLMEAEEIAVIIPIPDAVVADADFDVWGWIQPKAEEAIGRALDAAVLFDVNRPVGFPAAVVPSARAASNTITQGHNAQSAGGIVADFSDLFAEVEDQGFDVSAVVANRRLRKFVRNARNTLGERFAEVGSNGGSIDGTTLVYSMRGQWPDATTGVGATAAPLAIAGDFTQGIIGVRQDITAKVLTESVIQDPATGEIVYNLAQQDMTALRLVARFGFQVANYTTREHPSATGRYPFSVLEAA
jgi:HK97 family phage major capsid protein